jgi:hypothetical protein
VGALGVSSKRPLDRWCYAQHHAARAARERFKAPATVAVAEAAWANYWELLMEAERISERLRARLRVRTLVALRT